MYKKFLILTTLIFTSLASLLISPLKTPAYAAESSSCNCTCEENSSTTSSPPVYSSQIILSEIYPFPRENEEEFIEIFNADTSSVDLNGWILGDASGKKYTISTNDFSSTNVSVGQFFVIPQTVSKIYLNNTGDTVMLYKPDNTLLLETTYEEAEEGESWIWANNKWQWSISATKGAINTITTNQQEEKQTSSTNSESNEQKNSSNSSTDNQNQEKPLETSNKIFINELLPNPSGLDSTDEWLEIVNEGDKEVYLKNWQITDTKNYFTFGEITIAAAEFLVLEISETGVDLNNDGEEIFLIDSYQQIIQGVKYEEVKEGQSWARFEDTWQWASELTPGEPNIQDETEDNNSDANQNNDEEEEEIDEDNDTETDIISISIFRSLDDDNTATVEGVVTVLPGILGSQYFYIQDEEAGLQIYSYSKEFPELALGDKVRVTGIKSTSRNEARLKTSSAEDIVNISNGNQIIAKDANELSEELEGMLVQIEGIVSESSSSSAIINDKINVVLKSGAAIDSSLLEEGINVTVLGIVGQYDDEYRLMPRSNDDITPLEQNNELISGASAATPQGSSYSLPSRASFFTKPKIILIVLIGLATVIIAGIVIRKRFLSKPPALDVSGLSGMPTIFDQSENLNQKSLIPRSKFMRHLPHHDHQQEKPQN